jgi:hypothetical protein
MLSLSTVIANLFNAEAVEFQDIKRLASVIRKHERASAAFLADLRALNVDELKRSISSLSASYRTDLSKSGISYDLLVPLCDGVHKATLGLRNQSKGKVLDADKTLAGFNVAKFNADICKVADALLSSVANLKANAASIEKVKEENKAA